MNTKTLRRGGQVSSAAKSATAIAKTVGPVIVFAPQGTGKTKNAAALRKFFGCSVVVDDWDGRRALPAGALALTNVMPGELDSHARTFADPSGFDVFYGGRRIELAALKNEHPDELIAHAMSIASCQLAVAQCVLLVSEMTEDERDSGPVDMVSTAMFGAELLSGLAQALLIEAGARRANAMLASNVDGSEKGQA